MKYFIITHTIRDGEYEYMCQSPVKALSKDNAIKRIQKADKNWIRHDYRLSEIGCIDEITKEEFDVISKYIY